MPKLRIYRPKIEQLILSLILIAAAFCMCDYTWNSLKNTIFVAITVLVLNFIQISIEECPEWSKMLLTGFLSAGISHFCCCVFGGINLFMDWSITFFTTAFFFGMFLLLFAFVGNLRFAFILPPIFASVVSIVEAYVFAFRGTSFKLVDILAIQTTMQVIGDYRFFLNSALLNGLIFFCFCTVSLRKAIPVFCGGGGT